jgi:WD40 repeat protein
VESYEVEGFTWGCGLTVFSDNSRFATIDFEIGPRGRLAIRSLATGEILSSSLNSVQDNPLVTVAPDDSLIVAAANALLSLFVVADPSQPPRGVKNESKKHFTGIAFHPSGRYLAATSNDETVKLYDTATWEVAKTFTWNIGRMRSIAFSPDGTLAAAGSDRGKVVVWDVDL